MVSGIRSDGYREILGVKIGDTGELRHLGTRLSAGSGPWSARVMFVVSDSHGGLDAGCYGQALPGRAGSAARCILMRNLLAITRTGESPC